MNSYINKFRLRYNENNKIIILNIVWAFLIKGGALMISLITMPAYIKYFGNHTVLGLWFTILSILSWILTFDLGIGNGLRNHLVLALVKKEEEKVKSYISSSYVIIGAIVIISILVFMIISQYINWNSFFNISEGIISKRTLNYTVIVVFSGIMLQFWLKLISSILYALQRSAINNLLSLVSSIIILIYVLLAGFSSISINLILLAIVYVLAVNIPLLFTTILVFAKSLKNSRPEFKYFNKKYALDVLKLGGNFFWIQIMYMLIMTTNEFFISRFTRPSMVVEYQVYNRLFLLIGTIFTLALTPIWSVVTKAVAEKNYLWIKKLYNLLKIMTLLATLSEFGIIFLLQNIINMWLGKNAIQVNYFYASIFALLGSVNIWNSVISSIANGIGELKAQGIFYTIGAFIKIPISWFLVVYLHSWIGIIVANIIAMSLYCFIQPFWLSTLFNKKALETRTFT